MTLLLAEMGFASAFGPGLGTAIQAQLDTERCMMRNLRFMGQDFQGQISGFQDNDDIDTLDSALQRLIGQALDDLLERLGPDTPVVPVDVILCLPEPAPKDGLPQGRLDQLGQTLPGFVYEALAGTCLEASDMRLVTDAQTGPARVIESIFRKGVDRAFLFLCADSLSDRDRLNALLGQGRLFADEIANYAMMPGEAAAALLILPEAMRIGEPLAYISAAAAGPEPVGELDNRDTLSQAMSDAALATLDAMGNARHPINCFVTDFNNGRYRAAEGAYCMHRLGGGYLSEDVETLYPALDFGDTGAAYFGTALVQILTQSVSQQHPLHALIIASTTWSKYRASVALHTNPIRLFGLFEATQDDADDFFDEDPSDDAPPDTQEPPPLAEVS